MGAGRSGGAGWPRLNYRSENDFILPPVFVYLGRVIDSVVATEKHPRLRAHRLLVVEPVDLDGAALGGTAEVALDPGLDAGPGDYVVVAKEGAVVADLLDRDLGAGETGTPANVVVVAIADDWTPRGGGAGR